MDEPGRSHRTILCVLGTRPEAVKMAPVILGLRRAEGLRPVLVSTGQHRELLDGALADFGLRPDRDLGLMRPGQTLAEVTSRALTALDAVMAEERPDFVLAQGDTTTVLAAALASYYHQVPFGHVEAGLRTGRPYRPFPEEKNRVLAGHLADVHFAPTPQARSNLLREGIDEGSIHVTGNPGIDALRMVASRERPLPFAPETGRMILVTAHRRESFGSPLIEVCRALRDLVERDPSLSVVFPVHPNPNVRRAVESTLSGIPRVRLVEPVGYADFIGLMKASFVILTDSGGVQEEGPSLGKPVLVLRDETERVEAVEAGTVRLVGPHRGAIVDAVFDLVRSPESYRRFAAVANPYGDGRAADRIVRILQARFSIEPSPMPHGMTLEWDPHGRSGSATVVTEDRGRGNLEV